MKHLVIITIAFCFVECAFAQQPSIDDMRKIVSIIQSQRNRAADEVAEANLKIMTLTEDLAKARAELEDLKKKVPTDVK